MSTPTTDLQAPNATAASPVEAVENDVLRFASFTLHPTRHQLFNNGEQVVLGSRALDLLIVLATRAGELITKEELIAYAWPRVVVEACNLRAQIVALRRLLNVDGTDCIATVPGRGYRFELTPTREEHSPAAAPLADVQPSTLPTLIRETIGRDEVIARLCEQVATHRLITLVGPGGIGKTTVALEVAKRIENGFARGARFVDLSEVNTYARVQTALCNALGLPSDDKQAWSQVIATLQRGDTLLILDNCEHLLAPVQQMIATLRQGAPNCRILATSREPLQALEECLERLPPLALPRAGATLASEILQAPAVRLFVEHATAQDSSFVLHDEDIAAIHQLCQRLDGVPLEIEIAAARVGTFGIQPLLNMLNGEFRLQMASRRTAAKRHRSMGAVLDWSYVGLRPCEQALLRVASTFTGPFTVNAVCALIKGEPLLNGQDPRRVVECLVAKSLLLAEPGGGERYRLLSSTRLYANDKLAQTGGAQQAVTRHAAYALEIMRKAASNSGDFPDAWQAILGAESDSVRSALAHACSMQSEQSPSLELKLLALGLTSKPRRRKAVVLDDAAVYRLA